MFVRYKFLAFLNFGFPRHSFCHASGEAEAADPPRVHAAAEALRAPLPADWPATFPLAVKKRVPLSLSP
jgi:hypothetical protein